MITETNAVHSPNQSLRRRMNVLAANTRPKHTVSVDFAKETPLDFEGRMKKKSDQKRPIAFGDESDTRQSDDEEDSDDDSDDGEEGESQNTSPSRSKRGPTLASINTANLPAENNSRGSSPMSPNSRAWYEFDLAVVVALVSPIGNWLTGGDYIKNVFLVIMLIFYLHQIIEVPWELYHKARPRRRSHNVTLLAQTTEDKYRQVATSELRALEIFFLAMAAISPFFGASFLRYVTATVIGQESVSWFSTSLFVLATGMRPWSHVVERFRQRTTDLHDVVHYPSPHLASEDLRLQMAELQKRVEHLDKALSKTKTRLVDYTEEVYEYVDEAVAAVDRTVKKNEKKHEKQESKVNELEQTLEGLKNRRSSKNGLAIHTTTAAAANTPATASEFSLLNWILPSWLLSKPPPLRNLSHSPSKHSLRSFPSSSSNTVQLETIPEEEVVPPSYMVFAQFKHLVSIVLSRIGYVATMPFRAVVRMILQRY